MTTLADMADVLEVAAEHVRTGWTQNMLFDNVDGVQYCCSSGAIWLACGLKQTTIPWPGRNPQHDLWYATYQRLGKFVDGDDNNLPAWNDALGRTQAEVVDAMLHLAKELRNESS